MDSIQAPGHGSIFAPLLISMVGILATALAIVAYHLVLLRYCMRRQAGTRPLLPVPQAQSSTGVDAKVLETIPILSYSKKKELLFRADQSECAVCLAELEDEDIVRLLPNCRHAFHITCIDEWFAAHINCPMCRSPVDATAATLPCFPNAVEQPPPQFELQRGNSTLEISGFNLGRIRLCGSCVLPMEGKTRPVVAGLKRSLSMGQSYVVIDIQRESEKASSSCSSSKTILGRSRSYKARSMRQLDRASSSLRRSYSRLRMGFSSRRSQILPY